MWISWISIKHWNFIYRQATMMIQWEWAILVKRRKQELQNDEKYEEVFVLFLESSHHSMGGLRFSYFSHFIIILCVPNHFNSCSHFWFMDFLCFFFLSCWFHKLQDSLRMNTTTATNNEIKYPEKCELPHDIHVFNLHMHFGVAIYRWWLQNGKRFVRCLCLTLKSSRLRWIFRA